MTRAPAQSSALPGRTRRGRPGEGRRPRLNVGGRKDRSPQDKHTSPWLNSEIERRQLTVIKSRFIPLRHLHALLVASVQQRQRHSDGWPRQPPDGPSQLRPRTAARQPRTATPPGHADGLAHERSLNDNTPSSSLDTEFPGLPTPAGRSTTRSSSGTASVDKLTTALASNNPPDVRRMGNMPGHHFEAAGRAQDLTSSRGALNGGTSNGQRSAGPGRSRLAHSRFRPTTARCSDAVLRRRPRPHLPQGT